MFAQQRQIFVHLRARVIDAKTVVTHPCNDADSSSTSHSSHDPNELFGSDTTTSLLRSSCKEIICSPTHCHLHQYDAFRITSTNPTRVDLPPFTDDRQQGSASAPLSARHDRPRRTSNLHRASHSPQHYHTTSDEVGEKEEQCSSYSKYAIGDIGRNTTL